MLRLEPWEVTPAVRGTSSLGRIPASIGSGLGSLVQRVTSHPGAGTTVTAELPCAS